MNKIASICWLYRINYGGVETRAKYIAAGLAEHSNNVEMIYARTLFTRKEGGNRFAEKGLFIAQNPYRSLFITKHQWETIFIRKAASYLKNRARNWAFVEGQGIGAAAGILAGLPTMATIHGARPWVENPREMERLVMGQSQLLIAISKATRKKLIDNGLAQNRVHVVHNGVDVEAIRSSKTISPSEMNSQYGLDAARKAILSVHNFTATKNTSRIICAFKHLAETSDGYQLVFIGDGPLSAEARQLVSEQNIRNVFFLGRLQQHEVYRFYRSSEVFFLPSERESWGNVFLEAMAAGCPVITSAMCGVAEVLSHMKNAWVISNPADQNEINNALVTTCREKDLRSSLAAEGRRIAEDLDWHTQSSLLLDLIHKHLKP